MQDVAALLKSLIVPERKDRFSLQQGATDRDPALVEAFEGLRIGGSRSNFHLALTDQQLILCVSMTAAEIAIFRIENQINDTTAFLLRNLLPENDLRAGRLRQPLYAPPPRYDPDRLRGRNQRQSELLTRHLACIIAG
jgi:hypothetical protein